MFKLNNLLKIFYCCNDLLIKYGHTLSKDLLRLLKCFQIHMLQVFQKLIIQSLQLPIDFFEHMQHKEPKTIPSFIKTILDIIQVQISQDQKNPEVVNWTEDGTQFSILNTKLFIQQILPLSFKHEKFQSFVRQLNMYGFHKICRSKNSINFKNRYFIKDRQDLFWMIKRRKKRLAQLQLNNLKRQTKIKDFIRKIYTYQNSNTPQLLEELLEFKSASNEKLQSLKKNLDQLGKEINEKKSKAIKPLITNTKDFISQTLKFSQQINSQLQYLQCKLEEQHAQQIQSTLIREQNIPQNHGSLTNLLNQKSLSQVEFQQIATVEYLNTAPGISSFSSFDMLN